MSRAVSLLTILMLLCSCSQSSRRENRPSEQTDTLPSRIATYWNGISLDSLSPDMREQLIVDYLYLIANVDSATRAGAWPCLNNALTDHPDRTVTDYLATPDSPLYSPDLLDEYLSQLMAALPPSDAGHVRAAYILENTRKNCPGHPIADLALISATGTPIATHATALSPTSRNHRTPAQSSPSVLPMPSSPYLSAGTHFGQPPPTLSTPFFTFPRSRRSTSSTPQPVWFSAENRSPETTWVISSG